MGVVRSREGTDNFHAGLQYRQEEYILGRSKSNGLRHYSWCSLSQRPFQGARILLMPWLKINNNRLHYNWCSGSIHPNRGMLRWYVTPHHRRHGGLFLSWRHHIGTDVLK